MTLNTQPVVSSWLRGGAVDSFRPAIVDGPPDRRMVKRDSPIGSVFVFRIPKAAFVLWYADLVCARKFRRFTGRVEWPAQPRDRESSQYREGAIHVVITVA